MQSKRPGMSLVELMVALAILGGALMALAMFSARFAHAASLARLQSTAVALTVDRIETVKASPTYAGMDSYATTETSISGYPGFQRQTRVVHTGGVPTDSIDDYRVVTVTVTHPQLAVPEKKTTFVAAY